MAQHAGAAAKEPASPANAALKRGIALFEAGQVGPAAEAFRESIRLDAGYGAAWINLATCLRRLGKLEASAACARRALELSPDNPSHLTNQGNCLADLDLMDEALDAHAKAYSLRPDDFLIRHNYAIALREAARFEEALALFRGLRAEKPHDLAIRWDEALTFLQVGRFAEGWEAFEIRWKLPGMTERGYPAAARWRGEDLAGKTILVYEEQGFGDSILCSRYIPLLKAAGANVMLECKPQLHRLFSLLPGVVRIAESGAIVSGFDYHVPMMSLPGIFGTDLSSIPPSAPLYAAPSPGPQAERALARGEGRVKIGIVWSGSVTFANNRRRAADLSRFLDLTRIPGIQLYSLQKGPREKDLADLGAESLIVPLGPHLNDFSETAAAVKALDLVIMTDSSVAHLAGSLGVPVWNLLCQRPYWLYLSGRRDSPWYPSMRLFRQPKAGDWASVFAAAAHALREELSAKLQ